MALQHTFKCRALIKFISSRASLTRERGSTHTSVAMPSSSRVASSCPQVVPGVPCASLKTRGARESCADVIWSAAERRSMNRAALAERMLCARTPLHSNSSDADEDGDVEMQMEMWMGWR